MGVASKAETKRNTYISTYLIVFLHPHLNAHAAKKDDVVPKCATLTKLRLHHHENIICEPCKSEMIMFEVTFHEMRKTKKQNKSDQAEHAHIPKSQ